MAISTGKTRSWFVTTMFFAGALAACESDLAVGPSAANGGSSNADGGTGGAGAQGGGQGGMGGSSGGAGGMGGDPGMCVNHERADLLLALDNSSNMAAAQSILAQAVSDLVRGFANPPCIDLVGSAPPMQPAGPSDSCPNGYGRMFVPINDIHIGVITSSIGGHGADTCAAVTNVGCSTGINLTMNDQAHLISRFSPCDGFNVPTYANKGFLAWDPGGKLMPPGESVIEDDVGGGIVPVLKEMVLGVGDVGCGFESQLESIYRFLSDPMPYETITIDNSRAVPEGVDLLLLQQRKEFLRSDSLVAVLMLTDEDDCSIKEYGQYYSVGQYLSNAMPVHMPIPRQECAIDPADDCCRSCAQSFDGCPSDLSCTEPGTGTIKQLAPEDDHINLRCWDQKRRFGIDFLYPLERYVQAFSSPLISDNMGELHPNPLFVDLDPNDANGATRGPEDVLVAGLVGVPWQDIAVDKSNVSKGFKQAADLSAPTIQGLFSTWDVILGDPANNVLPMDPLMLPTFEVRTGINPITNDPIATSMTPLANPINGHDRTIARDDLQYACIFDLPVANQRNCADPTSFACICADVGNDNPLCAPDPATQLPTLQVRGKAHPSPRLLDLFRKMDDQALVGSVCPAQTSQSDAPDFGYRPFVQSILQWIARRGC